MSDPLSDGNRARVMSSSLSGPPDPVKESLGLELRVRDLMVQLTEAKKERVCRWEVDDDGFPPWATGCGHEFECIEDGLEENGFEYCPFCGGKVEVVDAISS